MHDGLFSCLAFACLPNLSADSVDELVHPMVQLTEGGHDGSHQRRRTTVSCSNKKSRNSSATRTPSSSATKSIKTPHTSQIMNNVSQATSNINSKRATQENKNGLNFSSSSQKI